MGTVPKRKLQVHTNDHFVISLFELNKTCTVCVTYHINDLTRVILVLMLYNFLILAVSNCQVTK